jgi:hypothetical protein
MITKFGKRFLTNYLAGNVGFDKKDLAIGIDRKEALVTAASATAGTVTYTANNSFSAGDRVSVYGLSTNAFNLTNVVVASANTTQFTVTNAATGTAVSGSTSGRAYKIATDEDTRLGFEFYRLPVDFGSIDIQTNDTGSSILARDGVTTIPAYSSIYYAVYKATLPQDIAGVISEIGLYPGTRTSINNFDSKFITSFENNLNWSDGTFNPNIAYNSTSPSFVSKIGESMVQVNVSSSSVKEYKALLSTLDMSGYSVNDTLAIAYKKADSNVTKIRVKLYSSDTAYYYADFTPLSGTGDKIQSISMETVFNNTPVGITPDPSSITQVGVEVTAGAGGATIVYFDGIRINDEDTFDPTFGLISRSVLASPLQKVSGRQVDIEYKINLGF